MDMQGRKARIYRPAKNAMQSGSGHNKSWVLKFDPEVPTAIDPVMGWTTSTDMSQEICLTFSSSEEAVSYAERYGIFYRLEDEPLQKKKKRILSYSANFRFDRPIPWTH
jgi:hypothetical protein